VISGLSEMKSGTYTGAAHFFVESEGEHNSTSRLEALRE
jgi:hypothetical protein